MTSATPVAEVVAAPPETHRCQVIEFILPCRRRAVATVLWHNGEDTHMCRKHVDRLDERDWREVGIRGDWVSPLMVANR